MYGSPNLSTGWAWASRVIQEVSATGLGREVQLFAF